MALDRIASAITVIPEGGEAALTALLEFVDRTLGLRLLDTPDIDDSTYHLIAKREQARAAKEWQKSDELRGQLSDLGIAVRDTPNGSIWEYA